MRQIFFSANTQCILYWYLYRSFALVYSWICSSKIIRSFVATSPVFPRCRGLYIPLWRHQMETFSALLAICAGNSPVNKGQWRGALMFSLICAWINGWVNNREAGNLRRHRAHYDVIVMIGPVLLCFFVSWFFKCSSIIFIRYLSRELLILIVQLNVYGYGIYAIYNKQIYISVVCICIHMTCMSIYASQHIYVYRYIIHMYLCARWYHDREKTFRIAGPSCG